MIGDRVFGTRLDTAHLPQAAIDSTRVSDYREIRHTPIDVPAPISAACLDMCAHFGLRFGAFDFGVDRDGQWFFFEVNPNGQWYWIEEMTGQPLSAAMAEEICRQAGRFDRTRQAL